MSTSRASLEQLVEPGSSDDTDRWQTPSITDHSDSLPVERAPREVYRLRRIRTAKATAAPGTGEPRPAPPLPLTGQAPTMPRYAAHGLAGGAHGRCTPGDEIIWEPYGDYLEESNVRRFMDAHGIASYEELIARSTGDVAWFWDAALDDLGVQWDEPYEHGARRVARLPVGAVVRRRQAQHRAQLHRSPRVRPATPTAPPLEWVSEGRRAAHGDLRRARPRELPRRQRHEGGGPRRGDTVGLYMPMVPELAGGLLRRAQDRRRT